jgi:hypothetical protein
MYDCRPINVSELLDLANIDCWFTRVPIWTIPIDSALEIKCKSKLNILFVSFLPSFHNTLYTSAGAVALHV